MVGRQTNQVGYEMKQRYSSSMETQKHIFKIGNNEMNLFETEKKLKMEMF